MESIPADDVFTLWNFHVATQEQEMATFTKGKMKYQYDKELAHAAPSQVMSILDNISNTEVRHVDMVKFLQRVEAPTSHQIRHIKKSNIHLVSSFPMAVIELEFVLACSRHFSLKSKTIKDADDNVIITLDPDVIEQIFKVPQNIEYVDLTKGSSLDMWNAHKGNYQKYVNS